MKKSRMILMAAVMTALSAAAFAQAALPPLEAGAPDRLAKSPRHGEWVTINGEGGDKIEAYVVYPERRRQGAGCAGGAGDLRLSDWIRSVADQLAAEGFIAIAPDFLSGKGPDGKGSRSMNVEQARTINSALKMPE